jgi:ABC-2 type transport system ATP-binding protein
VRAGRTVESATLPELRQARRTIVTAELDAPPAGLTGMTGVHDLDLDELGTGVRITCRVDPENLNDLLRALTEAGVRSLTSRPPALEELFLAHYRQDVPTGASR